MILYRKYRPQKFSEIEGQTPIVQTLKNELSLGKIAHAYIFSGPRGTGKTSLARIFAKALNCQNKKSAVERRAGKVEPCNQCQSCREITDGHSLNLIEIDAASNRGIDEIRALKENVRFGVGKDFYKIFIIDEVHMLTREAFNALLKTLEEPPHHTVFILATTEINEVPETILSRCQRFDFKKLLINKIEHRLKGILKKENRIIDPVVLNLISIKAEGGMRDAESILSQILTWPRKELKASRVAEFLGAVDWSKIEKFLQSLSQKDCSAAIRQINEFAVQGQDLENFNERLISYIRAMMLAKVNPNLIDNENVSFSKDQIENLLGAVRHFSLKNLLEMIRLFVYAKGELARATIPALPIELAIIDYCEQEDVKAEISIIRDAPKINSIPAKPQIARLKSQPEEKNLNPKSTINFDRIKEKWNEVVKLVEPKNYSLCAFLKLCEPQGMKDGSLLLGFPRDFHKNIVSQMQNRKTVEEVLESVLGGKLRIQCETMVNTNQLLQNNAANLTQDALDVLGGEFVK